jgi:CHAT domain-containing protein
MHGYKIMLITLALACGLFLLIATASASRLTMPAPEPGGQNGSAKDATDLHELALGTISQHELVNGEVHSYGISLGEGQYVRVIVGQTQVDLSISVRSPGGDHLAVFDSYDDGAEPVSIIGKRSGDYRLEVRSVNKTASARYDIKLEERRAALPEDQSRIAAEESLTQAKQLWYDEATEARRTGIQKYEEALPLLRGLGDRRGEAQALGGIGNFYLELGQTIKAIDYLESAVSLQRANGDRSAEATTLHNIGVAYVGLGNSTKGLEYYQQALPLRRAVGDRKGEGATLSAMGWAYSALGELKKSLESFNTALPLRHAAADWRGESFTIFGRGSVYAELGETQKALESYRQALQMSRAAGSRVAASNTLLLIGDLYRGYGDQKKALDAYAEALQIIEEFGESQMKGRILYAIGMAYAELADKQKAQHYYEQALKINLAVKDRWAEGATLHSMGRSFALSEEPRKALTYYDRALSVTRVTGDRVGEAYTLIDMGRAYLGLGEWEMAIEHLNKALVIGRSVSSRGAEAHALAALAKAEANISKLAESREHVEAALMIFESLRGNIARGAFRASFFASAQPYYEGYIGLLMRLHEREPAQGYNALALQASERARARSLLEMLTEARADIRRGTDPVMLDRERDLQHLVNAKASRLTQLLSGKHTDQQADAAKKELDSILNDYQDVQAQIQAGSPGYAALTQPRPLSLKEIQQQVLDGDTVLLEYSLGAERSYLWAVTPTSMTSHILPGRAEIEAASRRVYELLIAGDQRESRTQVRLAAAELSRMVLGPAAALLGNKRLLIVTDGALQYVPFAALPVPEDGSGGSGEVGSKGVGEERSKAGAQKARKGSEQSALPTSPPLIVNHEIISLPSASALAVLRQEMGGRQAANKAVAVLADPVLQLDDPRVKQAISTVQKPPSEPASPSGGERGMMEEVMRSARESGIVFERLRYTRQEAEAIAALVPKEKALKALDFEASRERATRADLNEYRLVHFATHGVINSQHPELSGVVLSLFDRAGNPQDGFLRLHDIYNLKLNADLVTLSACRTALGKEVRGEGLISLTRGFMYAGAARVVASLWDIRDEATAEMMKRFYQGMLRDKLRPAAALRAAQVSMLREKRWEAPYYWAGFVLQGEWR